MTIASDNTYSIGQTPLVKINRLTSGISCGAAAAVAFRLAQDPALAGKTIVVVLPDSGERYLSGALCDGLFNESGLAS